VARAASRKGAARRWRATRAPLEIRAPTESQLPLVRGGTAAGERGMERRDCREESSIGGSLHLCESMESTGTISADLNGRVQRVIELMRPAVQSDGGDIEFVDVTPEHVVRIRLHGACVGCPSSSITLQHGIERNLKHHVPEVRGVAAIE